MISYYNHDFKAHSDKHGSWWIDGGQEGYIRYSTPDASKPLQAPVDNLIDFIRTDFKWGVTTDKTGKPTGRINKVYLKDLETRHIHNIISYIKSIWSDNRESKNLYLTIFRAELKFREKNNLP